MYSQKRQKGNTAEDIVVLYLKNIGFQILDQNYLKKWGEIDIVAEKSKKIHFIEVKSSVLQNFNGFTDANRTEDWKISVSAESDSVSRETDDSIFNPVWNMTKKKKIRFSRIIRTYLADKYSETGSNFEKSMPDFQIDLFSVLLDFYQKVAYINRIEDILLENN